MPKQSVEGEYQKGRGEEADGDAGGVFNSLHVSLYRPVYASRSRSGQGPV
jgi:hypothetical protein